MIGNRTESAVHGIFAPDITLFLHAKIAIPCRHTAKAGKNTFPSTENLLVPAAQELTDSGIIPRYA
ncbi:hypothetical protein [Rhizobium sp. X9]|uniref:hypothetical protein n=1 Tax=Rhizobium sp. X9 TaxID=2815360 RepID=UPI001C0E337E|nr:hypothetical protein [Rhizobium sp. X9]